MRHRNARARESPSAAIVARHGPVQRLAAKLGRDGHDPRGAAAAAKAAARKARWPGTPKGELLAALDEAEQVQKWVDTNVHSLGPGRRPPLTDELVAQAIAMRRASIARLGAALAELTPPGR
jgi:hypothetical protein